VKVASGAVFVDGRRVHPEAGTVYLLAPPVWRRDGEAVAWIERRGGETRLVVLPELAAGAEPLPWTLPPVASSDQGFWAGPNRTKIGKRPPEPAAAASWPP